MNLVDYFYTPSSQITSTSLDIEGDEARHIVQVMRKRPGESIRVTDGAGMTYDATIESITRSQIHCTITTSHARLHESSRHVTLAVGLLKHFSLFDFVVEKGTEIGVSTFVPLLTERAIPRHAKEERWRKIAFAAMKQSGRCILPAIQPLITFEDFVKGIPDTTVKLIPHELQTEPLVENVVTTSKDIVVCIGPEGGFSTSEVEFATERGFAAVSLGPRRLRTETAAIVAAARVLTRD